MTKLSSKFALYTATNTNTIEDEQWNWRIRKNIAAPALMGRILTKNSQTTGRQKRIWFAYGKVAATLVAEH